MNNVPRQMLRQLVAKYGKDLCSDARRCKGLLKDVCGEYRREINVLTNAVEERVPLDLLAAGNSTPRELLLTRLAERLEDNLGLTTEASHWAVNSWALALGILSEAEVEAKEKKQNNQTAQISPNKPTPTSPQNSKIQTPNQNRQTQTVKRPPQNQSTPTLPHIQPPITRSPINFPIPAPKQPVQKINSNANIQQNLPQPNDASANAVPKKRFSKFFGCVFVFLLLIITGVVLLFGVPYAIKVMRETQQSEPPRLLNSAEVN